MKKTIIPILILVLILCIGCYSDNVKLIVVNKSIVELDSIKIGSSKENQTLVTKLAQGQKVSKKITFNGIEGDGNYFLEVYNKGELIQSKRFGYYTNGSPLNNSFEIKIYKDSTLIVHH
ncbi:hypothetical protein [Tenacibaculum mesophilum]|uniref:hypothetical protein n=1 Tax=Tenacibaculum mesophilum TaxID=104268 RepID=UPI002491BFE6|nr:hypothetical protein [Tenacibaculum mesophilum]